MAAVALALPAVAHATAQTVTVTSLTDSGLGGCTPDECTLREAVYLLDDGDTDADRIEIPLSGPAIPLIAPLPPIDEPLTIAGTGSAPPVISGQNATRVMSITAPGGTAVTLSGLTVADGNFGASGGAIMNVASTLTLDRVTVADSHTTTANDEGGGVYSGGPLALQSSTITGNFTNGNSAHGGGLEATAGLTIRDSAVFGNRTNGSFASGGGIMRSGAGSTVIENSTITDNHASPNASGGGAYLSNFPATIRNATIAGNTAGGEGGGMYGSGGIEVTNSIVSGNTAATGPDVSAPIGGSQLAFDLVGTTANANFTETVPSSNQFGVAAQLGPLADNGGPTQTMLPSPSSRALDQGSSELAVDQRGLAREVDLPDSANSAAVGADASDIGAVERQPPESQPPPNGGGDFTLGKLIRNKRKGTARLEVMVTAPGSLKLSGPGLKPAAAELTAAGTASLPVKATGKKKRKLRSRGSVNVTLSVEFTPSGGAGASKTATGKLKRRRHR